MLRQRLIITAFLVVSTAVGYQESAKQAKTNTLSACWRLASPDVHCQSVNPFTYHWLLPRFDLLSIATKANQGVVLYKHVAFLVVPVLVIFPVPITLFIVASVLVIFIVIVVKIL